MTADQVKAEKLRRILLNGASSRVNEKTAPAESLSSPHDTLKGFMKRWGRLYYAIAQFLGPVLVHPRNRMKIQSILHRYSQSQVILNVGSGPQILHGRRDIINLDMAPYREVDVVTTGEEFPLRSDTADLVICIAVLEHASNARALINEMFRVTRPGGEILVFVPFTQPFHAAPNDYTRWSITACQSLLEPFRTEETWIGAGPTSGMLWVVQEWLAMALSFGSKRLAGILLMIIMIVTFPIKCFDLILWRHPNAHRIASGFFIRARK